MTARVPKRMIRTPEAPIRGTTAPPRQVPGGGIPPSVLPVPPRPVDFGTPEPPRRTSPSHVMPEIGAPPAPPTALGRMKNSELRGKIAKLERDNAVLLTRLTSVVGVVQQVATVLETHADPSVQRVAEHLRESLK